MSLGVSAYWIGTLDIIIILKNNVKFVSNLHFHKEVSSRSMHMDL